LCDLGIIALTTGIKLISLMQLLSLLLIPNFDLNPYDYLCKYLLCRQQVVGA